VENKREANISDLKTKTTLFL